MEREIEFRGFVYEQDNNRWIYGNLIEKDDPTKEEKKPWVRAIHDKALTSKTVAFNSVGQYTGFRDMNGKKIYEGDILTAEGWLKRGNPNYCAVTFDNGSFIWHDMPLGYDEETMKAHSISQWAIVSGNVYENPELLTH